MSDDCLVIPVPPPYKPAKIIATRNSSGTYSEAHIEGHEFPCGKGRNTQESTANLLEKLADIIEIRDDPHA